MWPMYGYQHCAHSLMTMTDVLNTRTRRSHKFTRTRHSHVCHTDLQQDFSVASLSHRIDCALFHASFSHKIFGKSKGNVDLYRASSRTPLTRSDMDHTVLPANNTFNRKHFPGGATTHICIANIWVQLTTHLSTPKGRTDESVMLADIQWMVYPSTARHGARQGKFAGHRPTF